MTGSQAEAADEVADLPEEHEAVPRGGASGVAGSHHLSGEACLLEVRTELS